ncbi:MAG: MobB family relaxase [Bacteroidota bacterium]
MYIAISAQQMGSTYSGSVGAYVAYLDKENLERGSDQGELFFDLYSDRIDSERVVKEIDSNTAKLREKDPRFYSLVVSPSQRELKTIGNDSQKLKAYVRELMKDYAKSFHRNKEVKVEDLKFFAKIEHQRTFRGFEREVRENVPYRKEIARLRNDIRKIERGELLGNVQKLEKRIEGLIREAPHKSNGKLIAAGMQKEGLQTHVHIIVSRRDRSNTYTLSPMAKHKASEISLNGKTVKRGFNRDRFYHNAEKTFDRMTGHQRNFVETYRARNTLIKDPSKFYAKLLGLPTKERDVAFRLLKETGLKIPKIPTNAYQLAFKVIRSLEKSVGRAVSTDDSEMGY